MKKIFLLLSCTLLTWGAIAQGIDVANMDKTVRPQEDFFRFVNGGWLKKTEIPGTESRWGAFNEIAERNRLNVKAILEEAQNKKGSTKGSGWQQIGDMYRAGMDAATINQLGISPIKPEWDAIDQIKTAEDIVSLIAKHQTMGIGSVFSFFVGADAKNSKFNAVQVGQGGTSLPDRSYYMEDNERFAKIRQEYVGHIAKMFEMVGESAESSQKTAQKILKMETRLAEAQRSRVDNRDPQRRYNKKTIEELNQMCFNIDWKKYFDYLGAKNVEFALVGAPEFLSMVDRMLKDVPVADWKVYFKWRVLNGAAGFLSENFEKENFRFYSTVLNGVKEMQPRWKKVQGLVDNFLGQPLGQIYVERHFPKEAKVRMDEMIANIREAFQERIKKYTWMSEETKQEALKKLSAITTKIGYPDKWRDFSSIDIRPNDLLGNIRRVQDFNFKYNLAKIGQPVDKNEWGMTPPTVNAYYSPLNNEIAFPAGILQPPFFDFKADDAVNYGGIGAVIGHEITHGFDDQGSQFDADGNLRMWWNKDDRMKFESNANIIVDQFNNYIVLDSVKVNGKLTLGENIADLGGLTIAYDALQRSYQKKGKPKKIAGYTGEQRFFMGWATVWRTKHRNEALLQLIKTDSHSPGEFRANGPLSNMPTFFEAFDVKEGDKMRRPTNRMVVIW
jgi:putative endopeptidase